jgi:hypothetical protein
MITFESAALGATGQSLGPTIWGQRDFTSLDRFT